MSFATEVRAQLRNKHAGPDVYHVSWRGQTWEVNGHSPRSARDLWFKVVFARRPAFKIKGQPPSLFGRATPPPVDEVVVTGPHEPYKRPAAISSDQAAFDGSEGWGCCRE